MEGWLWRGWHLQGSREEAWSSEGPFTLQLSPGRSEAAGPGGSTQADQRRAVWAGLCTSFREMGGKAPSRQLFTVMLVCLHVLTHMSCVDIM